MTGPRSQLDKIKFLPSIDLKNGSFEGYIEGALTYGNEYVYYVLYININIVRKLHLDFTYPEFDDQRVHDATDYRDEVKRIPGILEEVLYREREKNLIRLFILITVQEHSKFLLRNKLAHKTVSQNVTNIKQSLVRTVKEIHRKYN